MLREIRYVLLEMHEEAILDPRVPVGDWSLRAPCLVNSFKLDFRSFEALQLIERTLHPNTDALTCPLRIVIFSRNSNSQDRRFG